MSREVE
jgi:hypothetical protein